MFFCHHVISTYTILRHFNNDICAIALDPDEETFQRLNVWVIDANNTFFVQIGANGDQTNKLTAFHIFKLNALMLCHSCDHITNSVLFVLPLLDCFDF